MRESAIYKVPKKKTKVVIIYREGVFQTEKDFISFLCDEKGFSETMAAQVYERLMLHGLVEETEMKQLLKWKQISDERIASLISGIVPGEKKTKRKTK